MSTGFQVTFDASDPERLGRFWGAVLGYVQQPAPEGFDSWDAALEAWNVPVEQRDAMYAVVDPSGTLPRLLFQRVPEGKTAKNRVHLDVNIGAGAPPAERPAIVRAEADRLVALGAVEQREATENGEYWIVLQDIEGNEFCVQ
jgi:hypothetical protein